MINAEVIEIDADLENSDWTKQSSDLPDGAGLDLLLEGLEITKDEFKKMPVYYLPKRQILNKRTGIEEEFEDEIINYQIYDINGVVGEFVTTSELTNFRDFIDDLEDNENIKEFIDKGASLLTEDFVNDVNKLKSEDEEVQTTIDIFQDLVEKADTVVIINDGLKED